jgi:hypothetical protein
MTWDIPEQDLDHSSECLSHHWGTPTVLLPVDLMNHSISVFRNALSGQV